MPIEAVDIQAFFSSIWGGAILLILGVILEALFAWALFRWRPLAFINAWLALVLAMLLAISSAQRPVALMLAVLAALNVIDIPLVAAIRSWVKRQERVQRGDLQPLDS